jgi:hypothetical protein
MTDKPMSISPLSRIWPRTPFAGLRLRISERRMLLGAVDLLVVSLALWLALATQPGLAWRPALTPLYVRWFVTLWGIWLVVALIFDLYHLPQAAHPRRAVQSAVGAGLMMVIVYALTPWLTPPLLSRFLLVVFAATALAGLGVWRFGYARYFTQPWSKQRLLIVGAGRAGTELAHNLSQAGGVPSPYRGSGYELVGFVDDDAALQQQTVAGAPVWGDHTDLAPLLARAASRRGGRGDHQPARDSGGVVGGADRLRRAWLPRHDDERADGAGVGARAGAACGAQPGGGLPHPGRCRRAAQRHLQAGDRCDGGAGGAGGVLGVRAALGGAGKPRSARPARSSTASMRIGRGGQQLRHLQAAVDGARRRGRHGRGVGGGRATAASRRWGAGCAARGWTNCRRCSTSCVAR